MQARSSKKPVVQPVVKQAVVKSVAKKSAATKSVVKKSVAKKPVKPPVKKVAGKPTGSKAAAPAEALLTAGKIALALKVPDAKVKKAIATLGLKPAAKKGICNYYGGDVVPMIKKALAA